MKRTNTLVVGQGIAGSLMAYMLHINNIPFVVIDPGYANTSSLIAAGMFTPVSGKRKTIRPGIPEQIPFAVKIYREIEQLLDSRILHLHNIYQVHSSAEEQIDLTRKSANPDFAKYIFHSPHTLNGIKQEFGASEIRHSGWVDCELFINGFAQWLTQKNLLIKEDFAHRELRFTDNGMEYAQIEFTNIVFCEGYRATGNPFFKGDEIIPCKGDILKISCNEFAADYIIKKNSIYLIPSGDNTFKAGSTYQWNNSGGEPDAAAKKLIETQLNELLVNDYTTIGHQSGIRPTTKNREIIAKRHQRHKGMFMLNGLGTRGILQGPWWAHYLVKILFQ